MVVKAKFICDQGNRTNAHAELLPNCNPQK